MIFNERYGVYYMTIAKILERALEKPLGSGEMRKIIEEYAFGESGRYIESALKEGRWPLLKKDGTAVIKNRPAIPLSELQKRWMKTISLDPRMRLFEETVTGLEDVPPLFTEEDIVVFDKYADGDPYQDEIYIRHFRMILEAIKSQGLLRLKIKSRKGGGVLLVFRPEHLEYSEKDDKFRVIGSGLGKGDTINLAKIISCEKIDQVNLPVVYGRERDRTRTVELEVLDERKALERILFHFAHLKKQVEKKNDGKYRLQIFYDKADETEILIRILSFGPMVKVTGPEPFVELIRERLTAQMKCDL